MKVSTTIIIVSVIITFTNAVFDLSLILKGKDVSLGPYSSKASVGKVSKKYHELEPADVKASKNAVTVIKLFRRMFGVGILSLPPLDPYTRSKLKPLTMGNNIFLTGKVKLYSLKIVGAKNFKLQTLEIRMKTGRVDFNISVPNLKVNVNFYTDLYLGGLIPLATKGQLRTEIKKMYFGGALQAEEKVQNGTTPNVIYQVSGAQIEVGVNDIKVALAKGMDFKNSLLQTIYAGKDYVRLSQRMASTKQQINKYLLDTLVSQLNSVLSIISVEQIKTFLLADDDK